MAFERPRCIAALAALLTACAGGKRDLVARTSDVVEPLVVRCEPLPPIPGAPLGVRSVTVAGAVERDAKVGDQFAWGRPFEEDPRIPDALWVERKRLTVDAQVFGRTLQADAERALGVAGDGPRSAPAPRLVLRFVDVRTVAIPGGLTELRGRVLARVAFRAALRGEDGRELWSDVFQGEAETRVFYFRQIHHERMLSAAYCRALARFGEAVSRLAELRAGSAAPSAAGAR